MDEFIALMLSVGSGVISGVIISLISLRLADRQRARQERLTEARRRDAILAGMERELQWNRTATRGSLDVSNARYMIGSLATVAFERHGSELATIAPDSVEAVFRHYSIVGTVREGIRSFISPPGREADEAQRDQWIHLSDQARKGVSNSATEALKSLGMPMDKEGRLDEANRASEGPN